MWPPMPSSTRLARTTIAIAFQRTRLLIRRSISRLPGYGTSSRRMKRIDVGGVRREWKFDAVLLRMNPELAQQPADARGPSVLQHIVERFEPLSRLECLEVAGLGWGSIPHDRHRPFVSSLDNLTIVVRTKRALLTCSVDVSMSSPDLMAAQSAIVDCTRCTRLRSYCDRVATEKRAAFRHELYWGRPVPGFGDPLARVLILGLAPAAHGANRTGRVFTGDGVMDPGLPDGGAASRGLRQPRHLAPHR